MNTSSRRLRRGETSTERPGLVFFRYCRGTERWVTLERFEIERENKKVIQARQRSKPAYKKKMRVYFQAYNQLPKQKEYQSAYYKRPDIRERTRDARNEASKRFAKTPKGKAAAKKCRQRNADKIRIRTREYRRKERQTIIGKIKRNCQQTMQRALKARGVTKSMKTSEMLGCTYEFFQGWIERQFLPGMTWENRGIWECDHCIPIARFDLSDPNQVKIAFGYENCRPIWKEDNRLKSDFIQHNGKQVRARELRKIVPFVQAA